MTYLVLSIIFLAVAGIVATVACAAATRSGTRAAVMRRWGVPLATTVAVLILLTAAFDNLMIALGFMVYSSTQTLGLAIGLAPLEDFSYPIAAVILLPALWALLGRRRTEDARG
jgi:lycopene cyclase domain-containing protein